MVSPTILAADETLLLPSNLKRCTATPTSQILTHHRPFLGKSPRPSLSSNDNEHRLSLNAGPVQLLPQRLAALLERPVTRQSLSPLDESVDIALDLPDQRFIQWI
jgi:hypothetical protein